MPKQSLAKKREWKRKLEAWKESELSGLRWCKENSENYPQFRYWKHTLKMTHSRPSFKELKEDPAEQAELELHVGDIKISFPKGCTAFLLEMCLNTLRKSHCLQ